MAKKLTSAKAKKILHDKSVHGHPLTEQQRKFFGAIAGGAKPYKAESGGWLDKYEQGGLVLKQQTKDNYGKKPNPNNPDVSLPPGFKGLAYNTKGRNYSPAWGGQFQDGGNLMPAMAGAVQTVPMAQLGDSVKPIPMQLAMGGSLPGAVGFMYARTQSPAPSNGPYAKKTKASAQNGQEMKYYQAGLDFKPKTISQDGSRTPLYVSDPKDPRLKAYQDSLNAHLYKRYGSIRNLRNMTESVKSAALKVPPLSIFSVNGKKYFKGKRSYVKDGKKYSKSDYLIEFSRPKKPVQPVILEEEPRFEKPIPIPRDTRDLEYTLPTPGQFTAPELYKYDPDTPTKFSFTSPTGKYNEQKTMYFPSKAALKSFVGGVRGATYQEGKDYASATGTLQDGGDIPVDPMGYWNPENVGGPVIIPSNVITMEGVDQPLLGISDTGDVQYMEPGEDYEFDGEYVTEYPVAQGGKRVPITVSDPNDPRLKAYQDSLALYNRSNQARVDALLRQGFKYDTKNNKKQNYLYTEKEKRDYQKSIGVNPKKGLQKMVQSGNDGRIDDSVGGEYDRKAQYELVHGKIAPIGIAPLYDSWWRTSPTLTLENDRPNPNYGKPFAKDFEGKVIRNFFSVPLYKEPVQPVEYRKPEPKQEVVKKPEPVVEKKAPLTDYFQGTPVYAPTPYHGSGAGAFVGYRTPQGDTVFVKPEDYERMGVPKYGREFIESKTKKMKNGGVSVNNADAQPLKKLDQLLNFTNYNKPTKGGWLDKYN